MFRKLITCITILTTVLASNTLQAKHKYPESYYQKKDCQKRGGIIEYKRRLGRIDCLTNNLAIEYDFIDGGKHYDCLGQALYYSAITGRQGVCSLIIENESYMKYLEIMRTSIEYHKLNIKLHLIKNY